MLDTDVLGKLAGATREKSDMFVNTAFLIQQVDDERVVNILKEVIKSRLKKVWGQKESCARVYGGQMRV